MYIRLIAYQILIKKLYTAHFDIKYKTSREILIFFLTIPYIYCCAQCLSGSVSPHSVPFVSCERELTEDSRLLRRITTGEWQISGSCRTARFQKTSARILLKNSSTKLCIACKDIVPAQLVPAHLGQSIPLVIF